MYEDALATNVRSNRFDLSFPSGKRIQIASCNHFKKTKTPFTQAQQHFVYF